LYLYEKLIYPYSEKNARLAINYKVGAYLEVSGERGTEFAKRLW
jgi:hypothetical protein